MAHSIVERVESVERLKLFTLCLIPRGGCRYNLKLRTNVLYFNNSKIVVVVVKSKYTNEMTKDFFSAI